MNGDSFLLEVTFDDVAFLAYLKDALNAETYYFWELIHFEEELLDALGEEEYLFSGGGGAFLLRLVQEVPHYQFPDVALAEVLALQILLLQHQVDKLRCDLELLHVSDRGHRQAFTPSVATARQFLHEQLEDVLALQPDLLHQVQPIDVNRLKRSDAREGFAEFSDLLAQRVVVLPAEVFDDGNKNLVVSGNDVECEGPESGSKGQFQQF
jgi:hypothetical protein